MTIFIYFSFYRSCIDVFPPPVKIKTKINKIKAQMNGVFLLKS